MSAIRWVASLWLRWRDHMEFLREMDERRAYRSTVRSLARIFGIGQAEATAMLDRANRPQPRKR